MRWYEMWKAVHFLGLIALFGSFVIHPRAGARLRAAATVDEAREWLSFLQLTRGMFHGGAGMLLLSGIAMAVMRWGMAAVPFVTVGMVTVLVMWIVFVSVVAPHMRAVDAALGNGDGPVSAEQSGLIRRTRPWAAMLAINLMALGVLFEMTLKLGWIPAITLVSGGAVIGAVAGIRTAHGRQGRVMK